MNIFPTFLAASGILSFLLVALLKQWFSSFLLDIPNHRSSHTQPTPRGGGLGFVIAFGLTSAIAMAFQSPWLDVAYTQQIWALILPLVIIGFLDDRFDVPAGVRYLVQLLTAGVAVVWFGAFPQPWLESLGIFGVIVAMFLTVVGMTALINFYNFMDGLDGLVAGISAIQIAFLAIAFNQPILMLLVVALLGFLWWNWSPAKIFMGDVGSTSLGAVVAIALLHHPGNATQAWSALVITLPIIADTIYTLIRRALHHENVFKPHRTHLYQRLQQAGWSHAQVALSYLMVTGAISLNLFLWGALGAGVSLLLVFSLVVLAERYLARQTGTRMRTVLYEFVKDSLVGTR